MADPIFLNFSKQNSYLIYDNVNKDNQKGFKYEALALFQVFILQTFALLVTFQGFSCP